MCNVLTKKAISSSSEITPVYGDDLRESLANIHS